MDPLKISVVIPALNEEAVIGRTLEALCSQHDPDEVCVVDGGSADATCALAGRYARVLHSPRGRGRQMNLGAREARGAVLLFLHADTLLPPGGLEMIRSRIADGRASCGRFRMRFDTEDLLLRLYASYTRFPFFSYGDQAFFVTREMFQRVGGYREDVPFEDIDFYRRLSRVTRPVILREPVTTSARRFLKVGRVRQKWINLALVTLYYLGWDVLPLKEKIYQEIR